MSGGLMNLGMGGFPVQRNDSSVILSGDEYAKRDAARVAAQQDQLRSLMASVGPAPMTPDQMAQGYAWGAAGGDQAQATANYNAFQTGQATATPGYTAGVAGLSNGFTPDASAVQAVGGLDAWNDINRQNANNGQLQYINNAIYQGRVNDAVQPFQAQFGQQNADAATAAAQRTQQQQLAQSAYTQQNGGGFAGGLLNGSYSQPFGSTLGGGATGGGFGGGLMGGSGAAPAASTGLTPFGAGGASTGQQPAAAQGWGGPFEAKNPWSLA